jgi:hypothetical protein
MIKRLEWNKKTAALVLGVVFTFSIVTVFLSGRGITIAENTTLDPVEWTFQRPRESVIILDKLDAAYTGDGLSANMYILMIRYLNTSFIGGKDHFIISMAINAMISNSNGFIESVHVVAYKDKESTVDWQETDLYLENLSLAARADGYRMDTQAYIKLGGVNHTSGVYATTTTFWKLLTPNTQSHQLEVAYEIVYYNGTAYNKIVQPFQLNIEESET